MIYEQSTIEFYRNAIIKAMPISEEHLTTRVADFKNKHIITEKRIIAKVLHTQLGLSKQLISEIMCATNAAAVKLVEMADIDISIGTIQQRDLDNFKSRLIQNLA